MQYIFVYFTDQNLSIGYDETVFEIACMILKMEHHIH